MSYRMGILLVARAGVLAHDAACRWSKKSAALRGFQPAAGRKIRSNVAELRE